MLLLIVIIYKQLFILELLQYITGPVAELEDALDLGSSTARCECSSHFEPTNINVTAPISWTKPTK